MMGYPHFKVVGNKYLYITSQEVSQMMDLQARFVLSYFYGPNKLPSTQEMLEDTVETMNKRWQAGYKKRQAQVLGSDQMNYYTELANSEHSMVVLKLQLKSSKSFLENLLNFREDVFKIEDTVTFVQIN
ncbi:uncharacterized protein LOC117566735 isoform X2 [Drosophila albomicans]|uniref:Flavin-containing monooxygenase n=1 Tax=Drosophila albomicans TaxID=7291 RepID=A0A9C6W5W5_DROAB|nr:uncharacterized protein LOC117566735 isoform X2 [Drosophila albomicans]